MKKLSFLFFLFASCRALAQTSSLPHLEKRDNIIQLIVNGKPFLILGGELHNSSTSGAAYMRPIWEQMKKKNLNTVIAPAYWELIEPQEGKFDFSLVDSMIYGARKQNLHLVILWFGSWKNGYSMYVPGWVKNDRKRFPRVKNKKGESFVVLSALSEVSMQADAKAFKMLMQHIRQVDEKYQTVIAVQIENEVGLFYEPRDYSEEAVKAYEQGVPSALMNYLVANKGKLQSELDSAWKANGYKTSGSWEDVFGKSVLDKENWKALSYLPEELFTVYHYSKYMGQVAAAGKEAYPIPMYVNANIQAEDLFHIRWTFGDLMQRQ
jgi:beta-galactosidase GanA